MLGKSTNNFGSNIYLDFPIWTVPQGNQVVDEKLEVDLLINEEGMIELGQHHFAIPNDLMHEKSETQNHC